jgi:hypothetical protein
MQSPNDWKNVELTGYLKVNSISGSTQNSAAHVEFLARGARNTNEQTKIGSFTLQCEATAISTAGYTANSQDPQILHATSTLQGRWIGVKEVLYNLPDGSVKIEQWLDDGTNNINTPGNQWHKVLEFIDNGHWGGGHPNCGGTDHTIISCFRYGCHNPKC